MVGYVVDPNEPNGGMPTDTNRTYDSAATGGGATSRQGSKGDPEVYNRLYKEAENRAAASAQATVV